jgi:hypothetical protein
MGKGVRVARSVILIALLACLSEGQVPPQPKAHSPQPDAAVQRLERSASPSEIQSMLEKRHAATELLIRQDLEKHRVAIDQALGRSHVEERLAGVEKGLTDLRRSSLLAVILPAVIAALAGFGGAIVGVWSNKRLQQDRLAKDETLADKNAELERTLANINAEHGRELLKQQQELQVAVVVVERQVQQLSLLYGPLRAGLGQSFALYRQMNSALLSQDSTRFRFMDLKEAPDKKEFQIHTTDGQWVRFRTVLHISEVYGQKLGVDPYFDEIVSIGVSNVDIIRKHAGLARSEEKDLVEVFGKYLAHVTLLKQLHSHARGSSEATPPVKPKVDLAAVFPEELHALINKGFEALNSDIERWGKREARA